MNTRTTGLAALAVFALTAPTLARAEPSAGAGALARELAKSAEQNLANGQVAEACAQFAESQRLQPDVVTLAGLAGCHEKEGKLATAWSEYGEVATQSALRGSKDREILARARMTELEPKLARLVLDATNPHNVVIVELDGQALGKAAWGPKLPVDRGPHTVAFSAPDKVTRSLKVDADEGKIATVSLPMLDASPPTTVAKGGAKDGGRAQPALPPRGGGTSQRVAGYVALGMGAVGLGVGTAFGIKAIDAKSEVDAHCIDPRSCDQMGIDAASRSRSNAAVSTIAFGAGIVATGVGAYLVLAATRDRRAAAAVAVSPSGVSLGGSF